MKKILALILALCLLALCAACGSKEPSTDTTPPTSSDTGNKPASGDTGSKPAANNNQPSGTAEVPNLVFAFPSYSNTDDHASISAAMSEITKEKLGCTVELLPIDFTGYQEQMTLMTSGTEALDILLISPFFGITGFIAQGQVVPITQYEDTLLADAVAEIGKEYVEACKYSGELYGMPSLHEFGASYGIIFRTDLLEKYNIDVSNIKSFEELTPILDIIKQNEPDVVPLTTFNSAYTVAEAVFDSMFDECGDKLGDLRMDDKTGKIITRFETDEYRYWCDVAYDWYQKGYVFEDVATSQESAESLMAADRLFCWLANGKPGYEEQEELNTGKQLTYIQLTPAISTTTSVNALQLGMARNCKDPELAMKFLNLLYTDADLMTLLANGIEGKHYTKNDKGLAVMVENSSWVFNSWEMGNNFLTLLWDTDPATKWEDTRVFNKTAVYSKAFGYTFDMTNLATEVAACQSVLEKYRFAIENGVISTDSVLDEFVSKLYDAGLQAIMDEKQAQLDAFLAS